MKLLLLLTTSLCLGSRLEADPRDLVERAIPFVHQQGLDWISNRECTSCHQVPSMLWSMHRAADAGLEVNRPELDELTTWAVDWGRWNKTGRADGETKVSAGNIDTMTALLLGRDKADDNPGDWVATFRSSLLAHQQPDGSWVAGGQLPLGKRPARETTEVTTMWTLHALAGTEGTSLPDEVTRRAAAYLASAAVGISTEWHAVHLLLSPTDKDRLDALLRLQHEDGGWGWVATEPADALGTGLALYALARAGLPGDHEARQRAIRFLTRTQRADGSWPVPSTRQRDKNKVNETATDWGTAWACIGLLEGMPRTRAE